MQKVAEEIMSVQPIWTPELAEMMYKLMNSDVTEKTLIRDGYEPVCPHGARLLWIKKGEKIDGNDNRKTIRIYC